MTKGNAEVEKNEKYIISKTMNSSSKNVVHLISGLAKGGAETMLYQIIRYRTENAPDYTVVSLGLSHYYEDALEKLGIKVVLLDLKTHPFLTLYRLKKVIKDANVLCCWMYHSNLIGYMIGRRYVKKIIWCIRHSDLSKSNNRKKTLLVNSICVRLSKKVSVIAYNGKRARRVHEMMGYDAEKSCILDNGCDIDEYSYDVVLRDQTRAELGIDPQKKIILSVARDVPIKDLPTFIKAVGLVNNREKDIVIVMCGTGVVEENKRVEKLCRESGLKVGSNILLLGFRDDVRNLMCAADVYVLHSAGEAFPNTLIQAMSCKALCVSTDVGDVKWILGTDKYIVKPGDVKRMADRVIEILRLNQKEQEVIRIRNRSIIENNYNIRNVVKNYEELFAL